MRLTVLGSSGSYPAPGRACAGHLVRTESATVLFDCGNGVISNLGREVAPQDLDAVFITHGHIDHFADIYALHSALRFGPGGEGYRVDLYAPAGLFDTLSSLLVGQGAFDLMRTFVPHTLTEDTPVRMGGLLVTPRRVDHIEPTYALVAEEGGVKVCYTSDTRDGDQVRRAADGSDFVLAEATMPPEFEKRSRHMSAREAGEMARVAGAGRLVLTHLWPTMDRVETAEIATASFGDDVRVADEMDTFDID